MNEWNENMFILLSQVEEGTLPRIRGSSLQQEATQFMGNVHFPAAIFTNTDILIITINLPMTKNATQSTFDIQINHL